MRKSRENRNPLVWFAAATFFLATAVPVMAAAASGSDEWKFDAAVYLWAPAMKVTPKEGDEIKLSFSDILDNLDMTFMGVLGARKGKWVLFADVDYLKLSDDQTGSAKIINRNVPTKFDIEMEAWIVTAAGGYNLVDTGKYSLDLLGGARYISVDLPLKFQVGPTQRKVTPSGDLWDGIIGVKGKADLADNWYLNYYVDAGTGDSSYTWAGVAGLNYQLQKFEAGFGYRYMTWHTDNKDIEDLTVNGPYAGVRFVF